MLVYTPKGNIQPVGNYLQQYGLLLEDPAPPYDAPRLSHYFYFNPHNPANGLINLHMLPTHHTQWTPPAVSGKSVEVQRSQVDELFKSLRDGDDLQETEGRMSLHLSASFPTLIIFFSTSTRNRHKAVSPSEESVDIPLGT